jgi:hypothetical protein
VKEAMTNPVELAPQGHSSKRRFRREGMPTGKLRQTIKTHLKQTELLAENKRKNKAAENPMRGIKSAIVPNRIIVPALPSKRVNIDGIIAAKREEFSKEQALCLTSSLESQAKFGL